jgi:ribonuclease E
MPTMLINATQADELRVALINDDKTLYEYITERQGFEEKIGNIYLGEITSIEPSLAAGFVNYGSKRHGFLPLKEIAPEYFLTRDPDKLERPNIKELLKEGQKVLIQVEKEERGNKGAALTTFISLAGSYLVLMPNNPRAGGISRRIEGEDRDDLREILSQLDIPAGMGLIVRTAGVGRSLEELQWDLNVLLNYWEAIKRASQNHGAPLLIHQESDVMVRAIRDYLRQDIKEIIIDNEHIFEKAKHYIEQVRPDYSDRLKLYQEKIPLFIRHEIEHQIELAYQRTVRLKSGGSLVIDHTEALVSIDINSARATKGSDIEETAFNTNLEASEEIPRQLRLRDIGGLIVIDYIDMTSMKHQREVENHLRNALKLDRARTRIGRISRFGLLEMSRERLRPSLQEAIQEICPRCNGQGSFRSVESLASSIIRMIEEDSIKENTAQIQVQLSTEAATYLLNEKRGSISEIEQRQNISILIVPNPNIQYPNYLVRRLRKTELIEQANKLQSSYKLIESSEYEIPLKKVTTGRIKDQPVVKNLLPTLPPAPSSKKPMQGLIKRLWSSMFGSVTSKEKEKEADSSKEMPAQVGETQRHRPRSKPHYAKQRQKGGYKPSHRTQKGEYHKQSSERKTLPTEPKGNYPQQQEKPPEAKGVTKERPDTSKPKKEYSKHYHREESPRRREERHRQDTRPPKIQDHPAPEARKEQPIEQKPKVTVENLPTIKEEAPIIIRPDIKKNSQDVVPTTEDETEK